MWESLPTSGDILCKADFHELRISAHRALVRCCAKGVQDSHSHYAMQPADQMPFGVAGFLKKDMRKLKTTFDRPYQYLIPRKPSNARCSFIFFTDSETNAYVF